METRSGVFWALFRGVSPRTIWHLGGPSALIACPSLSEALWFFCPLSFWWTVCWDSPPLPTSIPPPLFREATSALLFWACVARQAFILLWCDILSAMTKCAQVIIATWMDARSHCSAYWGGAQVLSPVTSWVCAGLIGLSRCALEGRGWEEEGWRGRFPCLVPGSSSSQVWKPQVGRGLCLVVGEWE